MFKAFNTPSYQYVIMQTIGTQRVEKEPSGYIDTITTIGYDESFFYSFIVTHIYLGPLIVHEPDSDSFFIQPLASISQYFLVIF